MINKTFKIRPISLALLLAGIGMAPAANAVDLVAIGGQWSPDGGATQIPMWGFAADTGQLCNALPTWGVGPQLTDAPGGAVVGGNLTINLRNCLSEGVSIVIPGQPATSCDDAACAPVIVADGQGRDRVRAFTTEAAANGGTVTYQWTGVKNGTFLYQSGSHPAKQVQMGLYGALTVGTYPDTHDEVTLLYSEIDPALHSPPAAATPLGYHPRHYLVNGSVSPPALNAGDTNHPTVLRFLNAGLDFHVPALNGSYMSLVAEDGNLYPFAKQQYSVSLPAGKTIDALWSPASAGNHVIYDRRGNGMVASLTVAAGAGQPIANDDSYPIGEDGTLNIATLGVLANDTSALPLLTPLTVPPSSASLVSSTSSGGLTLNADGSFIYTPNANFNGTDSFTYRANDGTLDSNVASVTITVTPGNDAPVAGDNAYDATAGTTLSVAAPGVMVNDTDIDGDSLTVTTTPVSGPTNGTLVLNADGSFDYTPTVVAPGSDSFVYEVCDAEPLCDTATVSLNIIAAVNIPPVAVDDFATVQRNSPATFVNLTDNDSDADGNLKDNLGNVDSAEFVTSGFITLTTGTTTTRGGTVSIVTNGVNYTPKRNFRGTDTFNYTVTDLASDVSNEVTVRVNVVK